jgi:uncharacterized protein
MPRAFLTAEWRNLAMLNYAIDPTLLEPLVPAGTDLDQWNGRTYVSLVGFLFAKTKVLGIAVPFHRTFEEINLRFYVRREINGEVRRAVTFIKELVPSPAIALVARLTYNEPYAAVPMRHTYGAAAEAGAPTSVEYGWESGEGWNAIHVAPYGIGRRATDGSEEQFITEHYWGYTRQRDGSTVEYRVAHEPWRVWSVANPRIQGDCSSTYGTELARILQAPPTSAFLADGSAITVYAPIKLPLNPRQGSS